MVWGSIISAGSSILGGLMDRGSGENSKDAQIQNAALDRQLQEQFAKEGIRWRVADAKAAGIHPLYALGAQLPSFSPTTFIPGDSSSMGDALARAGQDIGRAVDATRTQKERTTARIEALTLEKAELENDLLRSQIARNNQSLNPPMPSPTANQLIPGQADVDRLGLRVGGDSNHVEIKPLEVTPPNPVRNFQEPSAVVDLGFAWTGTGYAPVPSKDVKDRSEDMLIPELMWSWRNNVLPNFGQGKPPPPHLIPEGYNSWRWSYSKQEWQPDYNPHKAQVPVRRRGHHGPNYP